MKKIILLILLLSNILRYNAADCSFSFSATALLADEFDPSMINNPQALANWCGCTVTVTTGGSNASSENGYFTNDGNYSHGAVTSSTTGYSYGDGSSPTTTTYNPQNTSTPSCYSCSCDPVFCPGGNPANNYTEPPPPTGDSYIDNDYHYYSSGSGYTDNYSGNSYYGGTSSTSGNNSEMGGNVNLPTGDNSELGDLGNASLVAYVKSFSLDASYSGVDAGLLPEYLWKSGLIDPYAAGFVDGLWETIEGTWGIAKFLAAWQSNNLSPEAILIRTQTYRFAEFLNELAKSPELRAQVWNSIKQSFSDYMDETIALDKQAMYNQGKLIFDVVTLFIGVGEIKAILKGEKLTIGIVAMLQAIPKNLSKFVFNVRKFGLSVIKTGNSLLIKDGATQIALVSDNVLKPTLFLDEGQQVLTQGSNVLVKNSQGKFGFLKKTVEDLTNFVNRTLAQKLEDISNVWKAVYPEIFVERKFFEDIMGYYRYTKSSGWGHTADIADNFKAIDFYNEFTIVGNDIFAKTAVSMKTTTTKSVESWLGTNAVKKNLDNLANGLVGKEGISWNGKTIKYTNAEVHIYMPKENITPALKTEWLNKLSEAKPEIKFEIHSLEDFVK